MTDKKSQTEAKRSGPGRPTSLTPEVSAKICKLLRAGNFRETACAAAGVDARSLRNWLKRGAAGEEPFRKFSEDLDEAEAAAEGTLVVKIQKGALEDWRAAAWLLERRGSKRWGYKAQVEHSAGGTLADLLVAVSGATGITTGDDEDSATTLADLGPIEP